MNRSEYHGIPLPLPHGTRLAYAAGGKKGYQEVTVVFSGPMAHTYELKPPIPYSDAPDLETLARLLSIELFFKPLEIPKNMPAVTLDPSWPTTRKDKSGRH